MTKMNKKWIILCSTAIAAVYSAGYVSTEAQAAKMNMQQTAQVSSQKKMVQANAKTVNNSQTKGIQSNSAANHTQQQPKIYKDGTFTGEGMNRRGTIQVAVTLQNDKITNVQISNWGMHYSESDVAGLPKEILLKQNAQVDNVSGATYSTQAFADAVQAALLQAKNA